MRVQTTLGHVSLARMEADRSLVGTLRIEWEAPHLWPDDPMDGGYVHSLAIRNHVRGHQIGAGLLQWAQGQIADRGRRYIRLDCWKENAMLCRYYENLGFRRCGDFETGGWVGALYEKEVREPFPTGLNPRASGVQAPAFAGEEQDSSARAGGESPF